MLQPYRRHDTCHSHLIFGSLLRLEASFFRNVPRRFPRKRYVCKVLTNSPLNWSFHVFVATGRQIPGYHVTNPHFLFFKRVIILCKFLLFCILFLLQKKQSKSILPRVAFSSLSLLCPTFCSVNNFLMCPQFS